MVSPGVVNAHFAADDLPHGHAHGAPAESPRPKQLGAQLIDFARAHALLAARDAHVVDAHQACKLYRQLAARAGVESARTLQAATSAAHFDKSHGY
jgi:hypothetical protein